MEIINIFARKIYHFAYRRTWYDFIYIVSGKKYVSLYDKYKGQKKAFLLMEPEYGNLGDHAIAYASEKFIKEKFPEHKLIVVSEEDTCKHLRSIKSVCEEGDFVFIQGGGNMGSLYPYIERMRRFCVKRLQHIKVICMPVSVYFGDDYKGRVELKKSLNVYNSKKNLLIFTRDKYSYDYLRKYITEDKVKLVPDMVYYLAGSIKKGHKKNDDYMICLRKENESAIGNDNRENLSRKIISKYTDAFLFDTTIWRTVSIGFREVELDSLFRVFERSKCVITDRMHGMIISSILGTPCVVLKSMDTKILGSYEWIKDCNTVKLIDVKDIKDIDIYISKICESSIEYDFQGLLQNFNKMKDYILDGKN